MPDLVGGFVDLAKLVGIGGAIAGVYALAHLLGYLHSKAVCDKYIDYLEKRADLAERDAEKYRTQLYEERAVSQEAATTALAVAR